MPIFLDVMKEELERNLYKQKSFQRQIELLPKGYLSICKMGDKDYLYRKQRIGNKIVSQYVGLPGDENSKKAEEDRKLYLSLKQSLKELKKEEIKLRKAIKDYE